jgi:hypothetical protein
MSQHTFCSHLAMNGVPVGAIQQLAGRRHLSAAKRYMHLSPATMESAIARLSIEALTPLLETFWRRRAEPNELGCFSNKKW